MLTDEIYQKSKEKIIEIEAMGGAMRAIEAGFQQREIHETAWEHLTKVESGERKIVGINHGVLEDEGMPPVLKPDPELEIYKVRNCLKLELPEIMKMQKLALQAITEGAKGHRQSIPTSY